MSAATARTSTCLPADTCRSGAESTSLERLPDVGDRMTATEIRRRMKAAFRWQSDRWDKHDAADVTGWWRDPELLAEIGPALADLIADERPTVVLGLQSRGSLVG